MFERRNIVFRDSKLPALEERLHPLIVTVYINDYLLLSTLVDIGASQSACSLTTLDYLDVEEEEITRQSVLC